MSLMYIVIHFMASYQRDVVYIKALELQHPAFTRARLLIGMALVAWLMALTLVGVAFLHQYDEGAELLFMKLDLAVCCTSVAGTVMVFVVVWFPSSCIGSRPFNLPHRVKKPAAQVGPGQVGDDGSETCRDSDSSVSMTSSTSSTISESDAGSSKRDSGVSVETLCLPMMKPVLPGTFPGLG